MGVARLAHADVPLHRRRRRQVAPRWAGWHRGETPPVPPRWLARLRSRCSLRDAAGVAGPNPPDVPLASPGRGGVASAVTCFGRDVHLRRRAWHDSPFLPCQCTAGFGACGGEVAAPVAAEAGPEPRPSGVHADCARTQLAAFQRAARPPRSRVHPRSSLQSHLDVCEVGNSALVSES